ncbi:MAG: hypothetical protein GDA67_06240 [Nitrospira sp. CR1.3]|nr:hypothetical protein [Nitrospira sp. CR1.3]
MSEPVPSGPSESAVHMTCSVESIRAVRRAALVVLLLVTSGCGDLQEPASGGSAPATAVPGFQDTDASSLSDEPDDRQEIAESPSQAAAAPTVSGSDAVSPTSPSSAVPSPSEGSRSPVQYDAGAQRSTGDSGASRIGPDPSALPAERDASLTSSPARSPQPYSVTGGQPPPRRRVTLSWDPSTSNDATGYRVRISTLEPLAQYVHDVGLNTEWSVNLLVGKRYKFSVVAYNAAGESPPSDDFRFDLF